MVNKFKARRIKRTLRRYFISISFIIVIISFFVFYKNYHFRFINRTYNCFINSSLFFDFKLKNISIHGCEQKIKDEILKVVFYEKNNPLFIYDSSILAAQIQENVPSIKYVSVRKRYPHSLDIFVEVRVPIAQCVYKTKYALIDDQGVLYKYIDQKQKELPVLEGSGDFSKFYPIIFKIISNFPKIQKNIHIYQLVKKRRWNLILNDGSKIMLPQNNIENALKIYESRASKGSFKDYATIDLRVDKYIFLRRK